MVLDAGRQAWGRVVAFWFACAGTLGLQYAFGALYVDLLDEFGGSRAATAAVGGICAGVMDLGAVGAGLFMGRWGERRCCLAGGVLSAVGLFTSSYAGSLPVLYLTYGVVLGAGLSLSLFSGVVILNKWFTTRRALASGLANTGASAGPFLFGALWSTLTAEFGWRGTLRLLAAADLLLLCGSGMFFTAPPPHATDDEAAATHTAVEPAVLCETPAETPRVGYSEPPVVMGLQPEIIGREAGGDAAKDAEAVKGRGAEETASLAVVWQLRPIRRLCLTIVLMGLGVWVPIVHLVQFARDSGFSEDESGANHKSLISSCPAPLRPVDLS